MRKATQDYAIITSDNETQLLGIALGYDYCAEHEWGIKEIKTMFGIPESSKKNMGVKSRSITKNIDNLVFKKETYKKQKFAILYTGNRYQYGDNENLIPHYLKNYKEDIRWRLQWEAENPREGRDSKDPIVTAWSSSGFGVGVMGEKEVQWLEELYEAFNNKNVVIAMLNLRVLNPFAGTSLSLMIKDRLPQEISDMMYSADKEYYDREDYEKKIGMKKIIEKYGNKNGYHGLHYFMACSPKWINYNDKESREEQKKKRNTKYDIMYWVNYSDNDNNWGWYTVEEIKEWLTGKKKLAEIRKA